jgi:clan AA aspartic protease
MITGKIKANKEAVIELEVIGLSHRAKIEVVLDTGFTGYLMLPSDLINRLRLQLIGTRNVILGDGTNVTLDLYRAKVLWHNIERIVYVLRADAELLVGMSLLYGSRVTLDVVTDGNVTIDALP